MDQKNISDLVAELEAAKAKISSLETAAEELARVREELMHSESQYRAVFENTGTAMVVIEADMTICMANHKTEEIFGVTMSDIANKRKWTEFVITQDIDRMITYHTERRKSPQSVPSEYEFRLRDQAGRMRDVLACVIMLPNSTRSLVAILDITARKEMERALRESEQKFKDTAELSPAFIAEMDVSLNIYYANYFGLKTLGYSREELAAGKLNANELICPEDREIVAKDIHNIFHGDFGNPSIYRLFKKDRSIIHIIINSAPITKNGVIIGIRSCGVDITERITAENRLRESEERFRTIYQQSPIGIALFSPQGFLFDMNSAFQSMFFGTSSTEEAQSVQLFSLAGIPDVDRKELALGKGIAREAECTVSIGNSENAKKGNRWFDWHITPLGFKEGSPTVFLVQVEDITEKRKTQETVLQKQIDATIKAEALVEGLKQELLEKTSFRDMVSRSPLMRKIFDILPEIAVASAPVLINGESGTGKELIARSLHDLSNRSKAPFIAINCGALPDTLLESELFGYRAGAFTDAKKDKLGKFAAAEGGTIFFDEIGDISVAMQVKLLRVLQERVYEPLGATASVKADVRVIAATNKDLADLVKKGKFREDLYYRINVVSIVLPSLRERRSDIPILCDHFIERFNTRYGKTIKGFHKEVMDAFVAYDFPGNIRELENAVEHAFVFCKGDLIDEQHLPASLRLADGKIDDEVLSQVNDFGDLERMYLSAVLKETGGSRIQAAQRLGIHKATLFRKLKKLGIQ